MNLLIIIAVILGGTRIQNINTKYKQGRAVCKTKDYTICLSPLIGFGVCVDSPTIQFSLGLFDKNIAILSDY